MAELAESYMGAVRTSSGNTSEKLEKWTTSSTPSTENAKKEMKIAWSPTTTNDEDGKVKIVLQVKRMLFYITR